MGKVILEKILLKNWHAFTDNQFDISELSTLITGMNASGKTTLLDAISVILDGANANDFNVAVKDEGERRTISGALHYVVSGVAKRTGRVTGLILAQFYDQSYNARFINGVYLRSKSYASDASITQQYFSVINMSVDSPDFKIDFDKCKIPGQIDYPNKKTAFEEFFRLRKMQHIKTDVYKGLINSVLRAKLDCTPSEFVRRNILPEDDKVSSIEAIKNNYKLLDDREKLYEDLSVEAEALRKIKKNWYELKQNENDYALLAISKNKFIESRILEIINQTEALDAAIGDTKREKQLLEEKLADLSEKAGEYKSSDILTGKRKELAVMNRELITLKSDFDRINNMISSMNTLSKLIGSKNTYSIESTDEEITELMELADKYIDKLDENIDEYRENQRSLKKELNDANMDLTALKKGTFTVSSSAGISGKITASKELVKAINQYFSIHGIDDRAYLLYEGLKSIKEPSWQPAIEMLIGNRRAHIVVKPENEAIATSIQSKMSLKADTDIILSSRLKPILPNPDTVASQIIADTDTANKIINAYYGHYILCETIEEYNAYDYALMKNGMNKNRVSSHKGAKSVLTEILLIGKKAGKENIKVAEDKVKTLSANERDMADNLNKVNIRKRSVNTLIAGIKSFLPINTEVAEEYKLKIKAISCLKEEIDSLSLDPGNIGILEGINLQIKEVKSKIQGYDRSYESQLTDGSRLKSELESLEQVKKEIEKQISLISNVDDFDEGKIIDFYNSLEAKTVDEISMKQSIALSKGKSSASKLKLSQTEYNLKFHKDLKVGVEADIYNYYVKRLIHLEGKAFGEVKEEIGKLKESLTDSKAGVFKGIADSFTFAETEVEKINAILCNYEISGNKFKIYLGAAIRRKDLYDAIMEFAREKKPSEKTISRLEECFDRMINSKDPNTFSDLADYRNYLDCDVLITNIETKVWKSFSSEKGSFSGGQKETPYYMCLAAALSCKAYTNGGFRLIVLDEAFKNMDPVNKIKALSMFKNLNLQTLIFTSNSDLADCTDNIYVITKHENRIVTAFGKNGAALKVIDKRIKV
ncbi:SbcC/MukB-like Walker B domain-containing protein [Lacrimispora amygdalina]|uniref:SbcC/MukB-like Walker B domain-containing protein n=1 Tax=Lacrimispora amygdalina TaxID=253257 RepID=UPI000BE388D2|nr:SbcC/MukB-like Walker B domain-containing protein [Lacrimispora amygdalina]